MTYNFMTGPQKRRFSISSPWLNEFRFSKKGIPILARVFLIGAALLSMVFPSFNFASDPIEINIPTESTAEGDFYVARIKTQTSEYKIKKVLARQLAKSPQFFPVTDSGQEWIALVPVPVDYPAGPVTLHLRVTLSHDGSSELVVERDLPINVKRGNFPSETLRVQPRKVRPLAKDIPRIQRELKIINKSYSASEQKSYWQSPAVLPINSAITSVFGSKRVYNGVKQSAHLGTDLRAPVGTPVAAPLAGKVVLAQDLFFTGNTIILDHGYGLFSIYAHMSKFAPGLAGPKGLGKEVKQGDVLGESGMTGRASGPHLHWGAQLHGVKIDPMQLVNHLPNLTRERP